MSKKGLQNLTNSGFTARQTKAAEMLANPDFAGTKTELCKIVGVSRATFYDWMKNPEFVKYVDELIGLYTDAELSSVWKALIKRCCAGDVQAIKLYFELKGKYKQQIEHSGTEDFVFNILPASERAYTDIKE